MIQHSVIAGIDDRVHEIRFQVSVVPLQYKEAMLGSRTGAPWWTVKMCVRSNLIRSTSRDRLNLIKDIVIVQLTMLRANLAHERTTRDYDKLSKSF